VSAIGSAKRTMAKRGLADENLPECFEDAYQVEIIVWLETDLGHKSLADWLDACFPT
jgi:hypothetical protein